MPVSWDITVQRAADSSLQRQLTHLARRWDRNHGGSIAIPATYLETILTLR